MVHEQQDVEITSKENSTTAIDEDDLELSLSLRPNNNNNPIKNLLEPSTHHFLTKRDAQALRRHEAKLKRDFKRKAQISLQNDGVLVPNNQQEDFLQRCPKIPNLGFQVAVTVAPPCSGWNAGCLNGGFRPFQGQNDNFASEGKDCASFSSGSSSAISDNNHSISGAGANSSDAGSHSSHPPSQLPPSSVSSQLDLQPNDSNPNHSKPQLCSSYSNKTEFVSNSTPSIKSPEGATTSSNTTTQQNGASPNSDKDPNTTPRSIIPKEGKGETGKPPRPNGVMGQQKLVFSEMPYVSTTGNGPNGKTVTGFLYKYTKTEVSIICVCHGSSFSPAEFVEHAGGVDVEYPLRHIRVVPFAFG